MSLWKVTATVEQLNERAKNTLVEHLGIEFLEIGDGFLRAQMPVDNRTKQPAGLLHGGASVVLAETLGSVAAWLCRDPENKRIVGLEINANHVRSARGGWVTGITNPIHIGKATQIWEILIYDEGVQLVCISRLTVANIDS